MTTLFIGLGAMGKPMASNLSRAHDILLFDVNVDAARALALELGSTATDSLATIPESVDTVVLMVPNSRIVEDLLLGDGGLLKKLPSGSLILDMSSSEPTSTRDLAEVASGLGIDYVDAPVSGGVARATTGELAIMVGATNSAFVRAQPFLTLMGSSIHHVGGPGSGDAAKALNNLLSATNLAAAAEILTAAKNFGIAPSTMLAVLNSSTGRSQASETKYPNFILTGSFASGFGMDLMLKDLSIARSLTSGAGLPAPITDVAHDIATQSRDFANTPPDHTELVKYYEHESGVSLHG